MQLKKARRENMPYPSRRVFKKKVSIFADYNIIPEPDVSLELGKSISLTKAAEEEATRQVHATHERIVTESNPKPTRRRPLGIAFKDTSGVSKKMSPDLLQKLKGVKTLTPEEQLVDTIEALKSSSNKEYIQEDDEETDDETVHGDEQVNDDKDEELNNAKDADTWNADEEITDVAKADAKKAEEVKDDTKKSKLPPSCSSLFISSGSEIIHI
uniref:Uncharacterized protein n=1 Tax=Tanacetum cinerariifolium TaxID=118510 RepID=A0A699I2H2_TANCI|nr:hypothetical protein [Tanacetum cinerariifolium]